MLLVVGEYILASVAAVLLQNTVEWLSHKYLLHGWGLKKGSFFHFHWEHHRRCRQTNNVDYDYVDMFKHGKLNVGIRREVATMVLLTITVALPVYLWVWPMMGVALAAGTWIYFFSHALSHTGWFPGMFPWHRDHHMGPDQNQNWCVTLPWSDWALKTRVKNST